ncbi:hypothetical protein PM082_007210 [Marasmius tenuissimus]|nr:hypothetical protein PM082_007210 [Marasmius tenuissimus]
MFFSRSSAVLLFVVMGLILNAEATLEVGDVGNNGTVITAKGGSPAGQPCGEGYASLCVGGLICQDGVRLQ